MKLASKHYFGNVVKSVTSEHFHLSLTTYPAESEAPAHHHKNAYISLNMGSGYKEIGRFSERFISKGDVINRPAEYEHRNVFAKSNGICFNIEILEGSSLYSESLFSDLSIGKSELDLQKLFVAFINNYKQDELNCLVEELIRNIQKDHSPVKKQEWYFRIIEKIQDEYYNQMSIQSLAETADIHPNYLARKFKQLNGLTIGGYIRKIRIENSFIRLAYGVDSIASITQQCGFYDQSHFNKCCKMTFAKNPILLKNELNKLI